MCEGAIGPLLGEDNGRGEDNNDSEKGLFCERALEEIGLVGFDLGAGMGGTARGRPTGGKVLTGNGGGVTGVDGVFSTNTTFFGVFGEVISIFLFESSLLDF